MAMEFFKYSQGRIGLQIRLLFLEINSIKGLGTNTVIHALNSSKEVENLKLCYLFNMNGNLEHDLCLISTHKVNE